MPVAQREVLGKVKCRTCDTVTLLKKANNTSGFPYYVCTECSSQHFARGPHSAKIMRGWLIQDAPPAPAPAPAAKPAPSAPAKAAPKPAPAAAPAAKRNEWEF